MSKVKIMHVADLHLGFRQYGLNTREQDFYDACERLPTVANAAGCTCIILAGDNFDAARPQPGAVKALQRMTARSRELGIDVVAIDGNHDSTKGEWLQICGVTVLGSTPTVHKDVKIVGIHATRPTVFMEKLDEIKEGGGADILVIHQAMAEMADYSKQDYSAEELAPHIAAAGIKYVAMGDIHVTRENAFGGVWFAYPGAVEMNAADEPMEKSGIVIEWDTTTGNFETSLTPLETRKFEYITVNNMDDLDKVRGMGAEDTVAVIYWNKEGGKELRKAVEAVSAPMLSRCLTVRLTPFGDELEIGSNTFERKGAVNQLKEAVDKFFEEGSDEHQLVMRIMGVVGESGSMIPVITIVKDYIEHGLQTEEAV